MSILSGLTEFLLENDALAALIVARVYPETIPPATTSNPTTMPVVTYQLIDEPLTTTHDNEQAFMAKVQLDAWGGSYKSVHAVADAIHAAMQGYVGTMGDFTVGGVFRKRKQDDPNPDIDLHRISQDYVINYS